MPETEPSLNDTINGVVGLLTRRRWWILGTAFLTTVAVVGVVLVIPNKYSSDATLVVVQQQVSQAYVPATTTGTVADAVQGMTREVLSRTRLLSIIDEFGLYPKEKESLTPEGLAERMRTKDVEIEPLNPSSSGNFSSFKISFTANNPNLAQAVTSRLTSLFINENIKARENQAVRTTGFLTEQLEAAKQKLAEQEQRLRDFKVGNLGELPEQQAANLGMLTDLRMQLSNVAANLSRTQQQRAYLESLLAGNLARLASEKSNLLTRFTPRHPEVLKKDQQIVVMESLVRRLKTGAETEDRSSSAAVDDSSIAQLKSQVDTNAVETANLAKQDQGLRKEIADYQNRVRVAPVREQQLSALLRDYDLIKRDYADLMSNQLKSQLTANLERGQDGQHFRLVDPPTLPIAPKSPNRIKISLGGVGAGVFLGFVLGFLADGKDRSFHAEEEVIQCYKLPLVGIPLLLTSAEERTQDWKRKFEWVAGSAMMLALLATEYYVYRHG